MRVLQVGLAGFGPGGQTYNAPVIASTKGFRLSKILTSNPQNIAVATQHYPQAKLVSDYDSIINDREIDLVVITTPNHLHFSLAKQALQAGKHVIVEKPFTTSSQEATELIELAGLHNRIISVNHNRRWDSDFRTIEKLLMEPSDLGKIVEYRAHFDRFRNFIKTGWKEKKEVPGSGILYDLGSHLIDQVLVVFGSPTEVFAHLRKQRADSEVIDNFEILLLYPELKVSLTAGMLVKKPGPRYTVLGRNGSFLKYGMDVQEAALKQGKSPADTENWGIEPKEQWGELYLEEGVKHVKSEPGDYREFYNNIYDCIVHDQPLAVSPQQARTVIEIIEAALRSHQQKQIVSFP